MEHESYEKNGPRKWHHMTAEEKQQELQMILQSRYSKLLPLILIQQKLKDII